MSGRAVGGLISAAMGAGMVLFGVPVLPAIATKLVVKLAREQWLPAEDLPAIPLSTAYGMWFVATAAVLAMVSIWFLISKRVLR